MNKASSLIFLFLILWSSMNEKVADSIVHGIPQQRMAFAVPVPPQNKHQILKHEGRARRIEYLQGSLNDDAEQNQNNSINAALAKELQGLRSKGDPYNAELFAGTDHENFKIHHNQAFVTLASYSAAAVAATNVNEEKSLQATNNDNNNNSNDTTTNYTKLSGIRPIFYLDGNDGASTTALLQGGFSRDDLFVANEWKESVDALQAAPHSLTQCYHGKAENVLQQLQKHAFVAAYLDGCGGDTTPIVDMIHQLFQGKTADSVAIGFTLTNAETTGRELIDRIQDVTRATLEISRDQGYTSMVHVGDDPKRFGVCPNLSRKHEGTATSWIYCEK